MYFELSAAVAAIVMALAACGGESTPPPTRDLGTVDGAGGDALVACTSAAQCDDGTFCNGVARCAPGALGADARGCVASTGSSCLPEQTCNEAMRVCETACDSGADADGDGFDAVSCGGSDCDDGDASTYPSNAEVCDAAGHSEDCDATTLGPDADGDGFVSIGCCNTQVGGALYCGADCDDTTGGANVHPGAPEACNGVDDNCDVIVDEGVQATCYGDGDGDGYALVGATATMMCTCGTGQTATAPATAADCDDTNVAVNPAVPEVCNAVDDNCSGTADEGLGVGRTYYRDLDGDLHGSAASGTLYACAPPAGYSSLDDDCDDSLGTVHPGGVELCNGRDDDCNGTTDENLDGACSVGVGACRATGGLRCTGGCSAVAGTPDATFHSTAAANGSFDWDCNGAITPQYPALIGCDGVSLLFECSLRSAATCATNVAHCIDSASMSPHCGEALTLVRCAWSASAGCEPAIGTPGFTQACR